MTEFNFTFEDYEPGSGITLFSQGVRFNLVEYRLPVDVDDYDIGSDISKRAYARAYFSIWLFGQYEWDNVLKSLATVFLPCFTGGFLSILLPLLISALNDVVNAILSEICATMGKRKLGRYVRALVVFALFGTATFFTIRETVAFNLNSDGYSALTSGIDNFVARGNELGASIVDGTFFLDQLISVAKEMDGKSDAIVAACNREGILVSRKDLPNTADFDVIKRPTRMLKGAEHDIEQITTVFKDRAQPYERIMQVALFGGFILVGIFCISCCCVGMRGPEEEQEASVLIPCALGGWCCLFLLPFFIIPIVGVIADTCFEDPTLTILREFPGRGINDVTDFCFNFKYDFATEPERVGHFMCHYRFCQGAHPILDIGGISTSFDSPGQFHAEMAALETAKSKVSAVDNIAPPGSACQVAVDEAGALFSTLQSALVQGVKPVACQTVTPKYIDILNNQGCKGFADGLCKMLGGYSLITPSIILLVITCAGTAAACAQSALDEDAEVSSQVNRGKGKVITLC